MARRIVHKVTDTFTADDNVEIPVIKEELPLHKATVDARGDFGSGTLTAEVTIDGTNWETAQDASGSITLTADGAKQIVSPENGPYAGVRVSLGSSTNPDLDIVLLAEYGR